MSESTETAPQGGALAGAEPAATETATTAPAPAVDGAATTAETTTETTTEQTSSDDAAAKRTEKRIATLSARMAAQAAHIERLEADRQARQQQPPADSDPETERRIEERVTRRIAEIQAEQKVVEFKIEGNKLTPNFQDRCNDLIDMGCDTAFSHILLELPNAAAVAFALSEDPAAVQEIVGLKTPTARAIALGKYAATIEGTPPPMPRVSRAPAPPRQVNGTQRVEFNPYTAGNSSDGNAALTDYYMKEQMRARGL